MEGRGREAFLIRYKLSAGVRPHLNGALEPAFSAHQFLLCISSSCDNAPAGVTSVFLLLHRIE